MPITRPTTKTIISTTGWGIPITDEVNRLTDVAAARQPTNWVQVTLLNGWVHEYPMQYRKNGDNVEIRGSIMSGPQGAGICNLPAGFRLTTTYRIGVFGMQTGVGTVGTARLDINPNGDISMLNGPNGYTWFMNFFYSTTA